MDIAKDIISWIGVTLSSLGFLYQAGKTIKDKHTAGLSLVTFSATYLGTVLWLLFSMFAGVMQTCVVNILVGLPTAILIYMILKEQMSGNKAMPLLVLTILVVINVTLGVLAVTNTYVSTFFSTDHNALNLCISFTAGAMGAGSFLPQLFKTIKTKNTKYLSYELMIANGVAQIFWAGFWFMSSSTQDIGKWIAGAIFATILGAIQWIIVYLKYKYEKKAA